MNTKSFLIGLLAGVILTAAYYELKDRTGGTEETPVTSETSEENNDPISRFEKPESYENKEKTSFKVTHVFDDAALACEISNKEFETYSSKTVLLFGKGFYDGQIIEVVNPLVVGTYRYSDNPFETKTVPVIKSGVEE